MIAVVAAILMGDAIDVDGRLSIGVFEELKQKPDGAHIALSGDGARLVHDPPTDGSLEGRSGFEIANAQILVGGWVGLALRLVAHVDACGFAVADHGLRRDSEHFGNGARPKPHAAHEGDFLRDLLGEGFENELSFFVPLNVSLP